MTTNLTLLDPTNESEPTQRPRLPRPPALDGLTVGLLDISKARGDIFLDRLDELLGERGVMTKRYIKPTYARVAPTALKQQISTECDVLVEGLAD